MVVPPCDWSWTKPCWNGQVEKMFPIVTNVNRKVENKVKSPSVLTTEVVLTYLRVAWLWTSFKRQMFLICPLNCECSLSVDWWPHHSNVFATHGLLNTAVTGNGTTLTCDLCSKFMNGICYVSTACLGTSRPSSFIFIRASSGSTSHTTLSAPVDLDLDRRPAVSSVTSFRR